MANGDKKKKFLPVVTLGELFAMPLIALIDADSYAASKSLQFIKDVGFEQSRDAPDDQYGSLRTITFSYQRTAPDGSPEMMSVSVPLLTLVPLPLLSIREADLKFAVEVVGIEEEKSGEPENSQDTAPPRPSIHPHAAPVLPVIRGRIARSAQTGTKQPSDTGLGQTNIHITVDVRVEQASMPEGIARLLVMATEATQAETSILPRLSLQAQGDNVIFSETGQSVQVAVTLATADDRPIAGETVTLSQDSENWFSFPAAVRTGEDGRAEFKLSLNRASRRRLPILKQIQGRAEVRPKSYRSVEVIGQLLVEIRRPEKSVLDEEGNSDV